MVNMLYHLRLKSHQVSKALGISQYRLKDTIKPCNKNK